MKATQQEHFIAREWLEMVRGKIFFYPAAMYDSTEPILIFWRYLDEFWFCDKAYPAGLQLQPAVSSSVGFQVVTSSKDGSVNAFIERRTDQSGKKFWFLEPSRLRESYRSDNGDVIRVIRRRGFGQIAITTEFEPKSIGVFMHRGDSLGEGGSGVSFLANKKSSYEQTSKLFEKLSERLANRALVVSDGSNSKIPWVNRYFNKDIDSIDAYQELAAGVYEYGSFLWKVVGWMSKRNGPTLVWGLTRLNSEGGVN
jgi:hypothetical protein